MLVPVFRAADGGVRVVLVRRAEGGIHGGQIAFPGGRREPGDRDALETALRESEEEIGLAREAVEVLATLPVFETRSTGYRIEPFLARVRPPARWVPAPDEIAEVLEVPVAELADPAARGSSVERFAGWPEPVRVDYVLIGPHRLWGATYRILDPLLPRLIAGGWGI